MSEKLKFTVDGDPMGKERPRFVKATGRAYTPRKTKEYENSVAWAYKAAGGEMCSGAVKIDIAAFYGILRQGLQGLLRPLKKPDIDNIAKIIMDGLNGVAYKDDKQVVDLSVGKRYGDPRVEVSVEELV